MWPPRLEMLISSSFIIIIIIIIIISLLVFYLTVLFLAWQLVLCYFIKTYMAFYSQLPSARTCVKQKRNNYVALWIKSSQHKQWRENVKNENKGNTKISTIKRKMVFHFATVSASWTTVNSLISKTHFLSNFLCVVRCVIVINLCMSCISNYPRVVSVRLSVCVLLFYCFYGPCCLK